MELKEIISVDKNENNSKPLKNKNSLSNNHADSTISVASTLIEDNTKQEIKFDGDQITLVDENELEGSLARIISVFYAKVLIVIGFILIMAEIVFSDQISNKIMVSHIFCSKYGVHVLLVCNHLLSIFDQIIYSSIFTIFFSIFRTM